ncbi:hypothetical protein A9R01_17450 ['Osedax' symbiont bacterium Rs2_46_30_T18]|nr:hypothetical protein A9R01_17450 ['Osedax' symbiont bacterium Rs2_46_30_T18]
MNIHACRTVAIENGRNIQLSHKAAGFFVKVCCLKISNTVALEGDSSERIGPEGPIMWINYF